MPNTERQKLKDIFDVALQKKRDERSAFLNENCGGDETLRAEIESLLSSYDNAGNFMQNAAIAEVADAIIENKSDRNFGHYEIIKQIGVGGMGEVYLAQDRKLDRPVALKILNQKFDEHEINRRRFIQEAKAVSALNHPNIMVIHEIGETDETLFIVSEYIEGKTLREVFADSSLSLSEILTISMQIANALTAAHSANIVHRDIKPENIMVRPDGFVKILDFGLAKLIKQENSFSDSADEISAKNQTAKGIILGTVNYMSPEQAKSEKIDERTDIFSFGILIYEMLSGKTPFGCETVSETWTKLLHLEPEPLASEIPVELQKIITKTLQKNKDERYQKMNNLLADLQTFKKRLEFEIELERSSAPNKPLAETVAFELNPTTEILSVPLNNLTENFSSIIGREKEIAEIQEILRLANVRLLTLTGIGGTGKTTLAKSIAAKMLADFKDGVFFIKFAAVTNPELVASTIAQTLGLSEAGGKPIFEILKDFLCERQILLVIDNFEQITQAAPTIAEIISTSKKLKIIITSRVLLHLSFEREFIVPPLIVPRNFSEIAPENLLEYEAVKLFVERAKQATPNFALTKETSSSVAEICLRLDGLPLAIELAAARIKILSPAAILAKLENRLKLLTGGARDLPAHQQTMRGTIEWSYKLLDENEKCLFRRLAIFAGGFTFEAVEFVVNGETAQTIDVLDCLTSLIEQSLLSSKEENGTIRFRMLEVVREYANEILIESGEVQMQRQNHAEYFLMLAQEAEPFLQATQTAVWLDRLEEELDNVRTSLEWFLENDYEKAANLAAAIRSFWVVRGHLTEGRRWLETVQAKVSNEISPAIRFKLIVALAWLARSQGDYETARKAYLVGLTESEKDGDKPQIALFNRGLGVVAFEQNDFVLARKFFEDGLAISREINDKTTISGLLNSLGDLARTESKIAEARVLYEESLAIYVELGNQQAVNGSYINLGAIAYRENDYETAHSYFSEALKVSQELRHGIHLSYSLDGFAALAGKRGDWFHAACLAGAAENLRETIGFEREPAERQFRNDYISELNNAISEKELKIAMEKGRKLKTEEIFEFIDMCR
ncbi:MAG TPA: protein kinase [Pyrinomonadaceae bacterium]|nr:protein kinase [Pyrinomonadaceae bacterium]